MSKFLVLPALVVTGWLLSRYRPAWARRSALALALLLAVGLLGLAVTGSLHLAAPAARMITGGVGTHL